MPIICRCARSRRDSRGAPIRVVLEDFVAELTRGGRACPEMRRFPRAEAPAEMDLVEVRDIDLRDLRSRPRGDAPFGIARRRSRHGAPEDATAASPIVASSAASALSLAATLVDRKLSVLERCFRIRGAAAASLTGSGAIRAARAPPVRKVTAKGENASIRRDSGSSHAVQARRRRRRDRRALTPSWQASVKVGIATGSQLAGVPPAGQASCDLLRRTCSWATARQSTSRSRPVRLTGESGSVGGGTEALTVGLDAPRIGELSSAGARARPKPLSGALRVNAAAGRGLRNRRARAAGARRRAEGRNRLARAAAGSFDARAHRRLRPCRRRRQASTLAQPDQRRLQIEARRQPVSPRGRERSHAPE